MSVLLKDLPLSSLPRERLKHDGVESLNYEELISLLIRSGTKNKSVKELSLKILSECDLLNISLNKLSSIKGVGDAKAMSIIAALELGKRIYKPVEIHNKVKLTNTNLVYYYFKNLFYNCYQEKFVVLFLNNKKNLIEYKTLFVGSINQSVVAPNEIFKNCFNLNATSFICLHNHPSGDSSPSQADIDFTNQLKEMSIIMNINFLDHLIIGNKEFFSFLEMRVINEVNH